MRDKITRHNKKLLTAALYNSDIKGYTIVAQVNEEEETIFKIDISVYQEDTTPVYLVIGVHGLYFYIYTKNVEGYISVRPLTSCKQLQEIVKGLRSDYKFNALSTL